LQRGVRLFHTSLPRVHQPEQTETSLSIAKAWPSITTYRRPKGSDDEAPNIDLGRKSPLDPG
jgi:hypothetical protein